MPFSSMRPKLKLNNEEVESLNSISNSRTKPLREVERAKILLFSHQGKNDSEIANEMGTNRQKVIRCIKKALAYGIYEAIDDLPRSGRPQEITAETRAWIISLACMKPKDLEYPHELWTQQLLAKHVRENCIKEGYPEVIKISSGTISKILSASNIKPHKISSYIHRHDPDFESKSILVLHTYKKVEILKEMKTNGKDIDVAIVSYDEKPGIQAIGNKYPDLMPVEAIHPTISRDYEYKRYGTLSLLAGIDLLTGIIHYQVHEKHRSVEFIEFLKEIDSYYPKEIKIVVILDNLKVHTSKETQKYLESVPQRFQFIFTPKHASWLNIIESLFSKMTRSLLRGIRVSSKEELIHRISQYFDDINETPVIFKWKYKMDEMPGGIDALLY
jgi:transposase